MSKLTLKRKNCVKKIAEMLSTDAPTFSAALMELLDENRRLKKEVEKLKLINSKVTA